MTLITNLDTAPSAFPTGPAVLTASFTRPADTTAYATGDAVSDSTATAKAIVFPGAGRSGTLVSASLGVAETDTADFDLFVFDSEPTNQTDNVAFALVAADAPKLVCVFRFTNAGKVNVGSNLEHYRALDPLGILHAPATHFASADGNLYGLLVTRSVYTPLSACKFVARLNVTRV